MDLFGIALVVLGTARLVRLLVVDDAGQVFRRLIWAGGSVFGDRGRAIAEDMLECPFCIGFWISLSGVASYVWWGDRLWWQILMLALSVSYLAGHLVAKMDLRYGDY